MGRREAPVREFAPLCCAEDIPSAHFARGAALGHTCPGPARMNEFLVFFVRTDVWCHLAASWHRDHGLWLAINGMVLTYNERGAEDERETDMQNRATLGTYIQPNL